MINYKNKGASSMSKARSGISYLPRTRLQLSIFMLILWNSQILSGTGSNPFGIKGVQEVLYALLIIFSILYVVLQVQAIGKSGPIKVDVFVLMLVFFGWFYSALAANIHFGQPVYFGLFEERRILAFLVYFPVAWAFRNNLLSVQQLLSWIVLSAVVCSLLSILVYSGLVSPIHVKEIGAYSIRVERYGIGQMYVSFAVLIVAQRLDFSKILPDLLLLLLFIGVLIIVVQTRQILVGLLLALIVLRGPIKLVYWFFPVFLFIFIAAPYIPFFAEFIDKYQILVNQVTSDEYITESARALTISAILYEFSEGAWFGFGALSLLWNGGFSNIYHSNFYLADVGFFGSFYKFGLLAIIYYAFYLSLQVKLLRKIKNHFYQRLILAAWVQLLIMSPLSAPIEYRGFISGLLLGITIGCSLEVRKTTLGARINDRKL